MALLDDDTREEVRRRLSALAAPVNLVLFQEEGGEGSGTETARLLAELRELSDKVTVETHEAAEGASLAYRYGIERMPALVVEAERDYGIRYYGAPSGYEFGSLLEVMVDVAAGKSELSDAVRAGLAVLRDPVHIQVFCTPT